MTRTYPRLSHFLLWAAVGVALTLTQPWPGATRIAHAAVDRLTQAVGPFQADQPQFHQVQPGETLSEIAKQYQVPLADLMAINGITNADAVFANQRLRIPRAASAAVPTETARASPAAAALAAVSAHSLNRRYTVAPGDTVVRIAQRTDVDVAALRALNGLTGSRGDRLVVGQTLILPATPADLRFVPPLAFYTVRAGETLGLIAQRLGVTTAALQQANRIDNPDALAMGRRLVIPTPPPSSTPSLVSISRSGFHYHRVLPGETLSQIARRYGSTVQALVTYNGLPDEQSVYWGLDLRIPYGPPQLARVHPPVPSSGSAFLISISRQQCWITQGERMLYEWPCSTGQGEWVTRTGTFPVKTKMELAKSSAYRLDMPYWLGLYDVGKFENGIHGLPVLWATGEKLWTELIGQPATFGCAMLTDENAARLFEIAYIGMPVHIVQ